MRDLHLAALMAFALVACSSDDAANHHEPVSDAAVHDGGGTGGNGGSGEGGGAGGSGGEAPSGPNVDRSGLTDLGTAPLDYAARNLWLCRPGNEPNECFANLDATEFLPDGTRKVVPHVRGPDPAFDCFYVYPTVNLTGQGNTTDFSDVKLMLDPLLSQGARFTRICEVYAPLYRQVALSTGSAAADGGVGLAGDPALALGDVKAAFHYYLEHLNQGRNFVLIGHSQGTFVLTSLIHDEIDGDPALRAKMISALLIGGAVTVPEGQEVGGSFQNVPACTAPGQVGCVVAYNSFAKEAPPPANSVFGKAAAGSEILCTNPGPLDDNSGRYQRSYIPMKLNNPAFVADGTLPAGVTTPFAVYPDMFRGECVKSGGYSYLEISVEQDANDQRAVPPYRSTLIEAVGFGLHVADFNFPLDDLIDAVERQANAMP